jgi:hypothetical protein
MRRKASGDFFIESISFGFVDVDAVTTSVSALSMNLPDLSN